MNTISNILEDFFHCLKLPIKAIDSNYNLIYKIGVSDELDGFISSSLFIEKIKSNKENFSFSIIDFEDNINFLLVPISKFDKLDHLNLLIIHITIYLTYLIHA